MVAVAWATWPITTAAAALAIPDMYGQGRNRSSAEAGRLNEVADAGGGDPYDGVLLEYKNPVTCGHTFLTMTCHIQMLLPGQATRPHRHTGTTHYHAVQGQGVTIVDRDEPIELQWDVNDSFTLPPWRWHQFRNASETEPAILFSVTDRPMLEMTGLDREERG